MAPVYLKELIEVYQPGWSLRSQNQGLLKVPKTSLVTGGDRLFAKVSPVLWQTLPKGIRNPQLSLDTFKKLLKRHLFTQAYGQ